MRRLKVFVAVCSAFSIFAIVATSVPQTMNVLKINNAQAATCDYVDEDGYCVTVVDNSNNETPVIDESEDNVEYYTPEINIVTDDKTEDSLNTVGDYYDVSTAKYVEEYNSLVKAFPNKDGDEQCYINARVNGQTKFEAEQKCFTDNYEKQAEEVKELIISNKEWYDNFVDNVLNNKSVIETFEELFETIQGWFN